MDPKQVLFSLDWPFSPLYCGLMRLRAWAYRFELKKSYHFSVPVLSVGNLTMGGTGKTPVTHYIASLLLANGIKPAIISRGYSGSARGDVNVVADAGRLLMSSEEAGDEPYMLASMLPGACVITGKRRYLSCQYAIDNCGVGAIILDDGFQHLQVARDLDLVLFDEGVGFGNGRVFPGGDLREEAGALGRADIFLLTGSKGGEQGKCLHAKIREHSSIAPIYSCGRQPHNFFSQQSSELCTAADLPRKIFVFCGIANPERFVEDLQAQGFTLSGTKFLSDHQSYSAELCLNLVEQARSAGAEALICTDKDLVKLADQEWGLPLYSARLSMDFSPGFAEEILRLWDR